jgi:RimJ/RimL family protein N-acetyltransferase
VAGVILNALLLDVPERVETARLEMRATRAGRGGEIHEAFLESHPQLRPWMPWAAQEQSIEQAERHCREMQARWHAREEIDFIFYRRADGCWWARAAAHHRLDRAQVRDRLLDPHVAARAGLRDRGHARPRGARALGARRAPRRDLLDARNAASRRVAEKSGFELEGIHRSARRDTSGALSDACTYARVF